MPINLSSIFKRFKQESKDDLLERKKKAEGALLEAEVKEQGLASQLDKMETQLKKLFQQYDDSSVSKVQKIKLKNDIKRLHSRKKSLENDLETIGNTTLRYTELINTIDMAIGLKQGDIVEEDYDAAALAADESGETYLGRDRAAKSMQHDTHRTRERIKGQQEPDDFDLDAMRLDNGLESTGTGKSKDTELERIRKEFLTE